MGVVNNKHWLDPLSVELVRHVHVACRRYTDFKFGIDALRDIPDNNPWNNFEKGAWTGSREPVNFWALSDNG